MGKSSSQPPDSPPSYGSMCFSSCVAGVVARCFVHPLDTVKARLQAPGGTALYRGLVAGLRTTVASEGLAGLYRGFPVVVVGGTPATCLYLTSYDISKRWCDPSKPGPFFHTPPAAIHLLCGMLAETVCCVVFVPVDVVKERLQVQRSGTAAASAAIPPVYRGSFDALRTIAATEGVKGVYRGYGATLLSFGPFSGFYFMFYEQLKGLALVQSVSPGEAPTPLATLACASGAGALAAWVTSPLDMAKLRMQVERGATTAAMGGAGGGRRAAPVQELQYPTFLRSIKHIFRTEGAAGLWRGSVARMAFTAPNTAITMAVYEEMKNRV